MEQDGDSHVAERVGQLNQSPDEIDGLAARGELPDAAVSESGLKITPLTNNVPEEASALIRRAYALLPHIKITDLLLEVDRWTGLSKHFTHLKTSMHLLMQSKIDFKVLPIALPCCAVHSRSRSRLRPGRASFNRSIVT